MKQTFAVIFFVLMFFLGFVYFFISPQQIVIVAQSCNAPKTTVQRVFASNFLRNKWMPKEVKKINDNQFLYNGCTFRFATDFFQSNRVAVSYKSIEANSLFISQSVGDSCLVGLNFILPETNFINRLPQYFNAQHISKTSQQLLKSLSNFLAKPENIYGTTMQQTFVKDTTLISIKAATVQYPTVSDIYKNIEILQKFAKQNNAIQTNPPMLHILKNMESGYNFMVAIPVNKWIANSGAIMGKRMLPGGNMLESGEVVGGFYTVDNYLKELENYKTDLNSISPAIPYQSLITDRLKVADTNLWVTKLYYPVF